VGDYSDPETPESHYNVLAVSKEMTAMGLTLSDAVRLLLTRVAHDKALPFEPLIPSATTIQAMKDARSALVTKAASLDALFVDLNADT
jgi:DNA-damage-inducible protein J